MSNKISYGIAVNPGVLALALREQGLPGQRSRTAIRRLRTERRRRSIAPAPAAAPIDRLYRRAVADATAEIERRGGETTITSATQVFRLGVADRDPAQRLWLLSVSGWRKYGKDGHRYVTIAYLYGVDDAGPWAVRVPGTTATVAGALYWITPAAVHNAVAAGRRVDRQGDVYAIETTRAHDGSGELPDGHVFDPEARTLIHQPDDGRAHAPPAPAEPGAVRGAAHVRHGPGCRVAQRRLTGAARCRVGPDGPPGAAQPRPAPPVERETEMTTVDQDAAMRAAITSAVPDGLTWTVRISARRKSFGATVEPGGAVLFAVPAGADPGVVAAAIRRMRGKLAVAVDHARTRGVHIARKELVNGEGFVFAGVNHRLNLVVDGDERDDRTHAGPLTRHPGVPIVAEDGPSTWSGIRTHQLTMRRDAASAHTIIEWYRAQGQAWLDREMPRILDRAGVPADARPTWFVRPYRAGAVCGGSWGSYHPGRHTIGVDWRVFQFPAERLRHVAAHEAAHAALRGRARQPHGPEWQALMFRFGPDWRERERLTRTAEGLTIWNGEITASPEPSPETAAPFVSGWATFAGATR